MTAVMTGRPRPGAVSPQGLRAAVAGTLRSEATKIRSVRSTYWSLFLLVVAGIAWPLALSQANSAPAPALVFDPALPPVHAADFPGVMNRLHGQRATTHLNFFNNPLVRSPIRLECSGATNH